MWRRATAPLLLAYQASGKARSLQRPLSPWSGGGSRGRSVVGGDANAPIATAARSVRVDGGSGSSSINSRRGDGSGLTRIAGDARRRASCASSGDARRLGFGLTTPWNNLGTTGSSSTAVDSRTAVFVSPLSCVTGAHHCKIERGGCVRRALGTGSIAPATAFPGFRSAEALIGLRIRVLVGERWKVAAVLPPPVLFRWYSSSSSGSDRVGSASGGDEKDTKRSKKGAAAHSAVAPQHEEWIAFQRRIAVEGFETGQQVDAVVGRSRRGGRRVASQRRKRNAEKEGLEEDAKRFTDLKGGEFPPKRYDPEETARLLAQAYANLPERAGKRGTRNLKRQKRRWFLVRKVRKLYKHHIANFHERRMQKRSSKVQQVKEVLRIAPNVRLSDRQYQADVFAQWASRMQEPKESRSDDLS